MKIKHLWSVLCKASVIDQDDNNISLHGILEQLTVSLVPKDPAKKFNKIGIPLNYEIVSLWQKNEKSQVAMGEIEYIFIDPKGKELFINTQIMEIPKTSRRFRSRMKISGLPLTINGDYIFQIRLKEKDSGEFKLVSELPLEIEIKFERDLSKSN